MTCSRRSCDASGSMPTEPPGIGVDVETIARWRDPALRLEALFAAAELRHAADTDDPARHLAGTWCAKEAVFKALSCWVSAGRAPRVSLRDIAIERLPDGRPEVVLSRPWTGTIRVSISHTRDLAVAVAQATPAG